MTTFKTICPYCNSLEDVKRLDNDEIIVVRQKDILVNSHWLECTKCNNAFDDPKDTFDVLYEAYKAYNQQYPNDLIDLSRWE
jgi:hypothetical protein